MPTATLNPISQTTQKAPERVGPNTPGLIPDGREQNFEKEPGTSPIPNIFINSFRPSDIISGVGDFAKETGSAFGDLFNNVTSGETSTVNPPSQGSIENFNQPRGEQLSPEAAVAEARRIFQETKERQAHFEGINASIEQVTQVKAVEEDARFDLNVMPDDQFAEKADYKNPGFRGALRTIANRVYVFGKLIAEKLQLIKEKVTPVQILSKRKASKAAAPGGNEVLFNQNAVDGQGIVTASHGVG